MRVSPTPHAWRSIERQARPEPLPALELPAEMEASVPRPAATAAQLINRLQSLKVTERQGVAGRYMKVATGEPLTVAELQRELSRLRHDDPLEAQSVTDWMKISAPDLLALIESRLD